MIEVLAIINKFLDLKIVQWILLSTQIASMVAIIVIGLKFNLLKVEHAFLQAETAKLAEGVKTQNAKIEELGKQAEVYLKNYVDASKKSQEVQASTAKSLKAIAEYTFDGDCTTNVNTALGIIQGKK